MREGGRLCGEGWPCHSGCHQHKYGGRSSSGMRTLVTQSGSGGGHKTEWEGDAAHAHVRPRLLLSDSGGRG